VFCGLTAVLILERRFWVCLNVFKAPPTWGSSTPYLHKIWDNREPVVVLTKRDKQGRENAQSPEICGQNYRKQSDRVNLILIQKYYIGKPSSTVLK